MTGDPKMGRDALDRLADAFVEDILSASDEDILAEIAEDYGDPERLSEEMRALFERTILEQGKAKLAAAKEAATEARETGDSVVGIDQAEARRRYESIIDNDRELSSKLTLAARKGEGQSERDVESAIEDLSELGALDDEEEQDT